MTAQALADFRVNGGTLGSRLELAFLSVHMLEN
jgi:hypothetical protein